jgi:hypothetical protein
MSTGLIPGRDGVPTAPKPSKTTQTVQLPHTMEVDRECLELYQLCKAYSMVDIWIFQSLYRSVRYVLDHEIPGGLVECGVWRGGCCMFMALMAMRRGITDRDIYLYDTYAGMTEPGDHDYHLRNLDPARETWQAQRQEGRNDWCYASLDEVKRNLVLTRYPAERLHFVKGPVERTIPGTAPERISLLRLDTDFYDSTRHELIHLYPRLSQGGVLILDDYGTWAGQRKAAHDYFQEHGVAMLLQTASTSATGVKTEPSRVASASGWPETLPPL